LGLFPGAPVQRDVRDANGRPSRVRVGRHRREMRRASCTATHTANLFFEPDGRIGYLEWPHAMRGCWTFDLGNRGGHRAGRRRTSRARELLTGYLARLAEHAVAPPPFDEAWATYRRYAMSTFMRALCPPDVHPEALCTRNTARACAAIEDLESLVALSTSDR
jgi:hypothetical protein